MNDLFASKFLTQMQMQSGVDTRPDIIIGLDAVLTGMAHHAPTLILTTIEHLRPTRSGAPHATYALE